MPAMRRLALLLAAFASAEAEEPRYPGLDPAELGDPAKLAALEDDVNAWFDAESDKDRAARLAAIEKSGYPLRVVDAVVRLGRRYGPVEGDYVGNISVPDSYRPDRPLPILVGFNGLSDGWEREAAIHGFGTMMPWKVDAWVDPRATDRVVEQIWEASRTLNVDPDRLYVTGMSVGGHGAWIAGAARSDTWAAVLPVSGSPGRILVAMSEIYLKNFRHLPVYATVGGDDEEIAAMARKGQSVMKRFENVSQLDVLEKRGHESFDDRAEALLDWAAELRRARHPAKLDWYGGQDLGRRHFWVEVLKDATKERPLEIETVKGMVSRAIPVRPFHVIAEVRGQEVSVHTKDVTRLRLSFSPAMLDLEKDVVVKLNGRVEWKGRPAPSVRTLLDSSLSRRDRSRTFWWSLELEVE